MVILRSLLIKLREEAYNLVYYGSDCYTESNNLTLFTAIYMEKEKLYKIFDEVYKEYATGIFRFIYFRVSDSDLAQDITEDTFLRYWKQLNNKEEIGNNKALLYVIARGLIIDFYRKKSKKPVSIDTIEERFLSSLDKTEDELLIKQEIEHVFTLIKKLKKEYQEILLLHYVEDLEVSELAFILSKKENTIRVLLHRALKALKEVI